MWKPSKSQRAADNPARRVVLLAAPTVLPYDEWSARRFGKLKAQLEQVGEVIGDIGFSLTAIRTLCLKRNPP